VEEYRSGMGVQELRIIETDVFTSVAAARFETAVKIRGHRPAVNPLMFLFFDFFSGHSGSRDGA
jgi:hypothetical protein